MQSKIFSSVAETVKKMAPVLSEVRAMSSDMQSGLRWVGSKIETAASSLFFWIVISPFIIGGIILWHEHQKDVEYKKKQAEARAEIQQRYLREYPQGPTTEEVVPVWPRRR
jgi:hypothetical protein